MNKPTKNTKPITTAIEMKAQEKNNISFSPFRKQFLNLNLFHPKCECEDAELLDERLHPDL